MTTLREKIENRDRPLLLYSFAPPKITTDPEKLEVIAGKQVKRINEMDIDGFILYDIQDESQRTNEPRTYPFISTIAPEHYYKQFLNAVRQPVIIYKSVANQSKQGFKDWLTQNESLNNFVFVGASSNKQTEAAPFNLPDAYTLRNESFNHLLLGGITIPERHAKKADEHKRIFSKVQRGCSFFVSQCVYNLHDTKNLLSDYYYDSIDNEQHLKPILFTLSPCGSFKTLEFMKWLGIEVPKWLYNDLKHSKDILQESIATSTRIAYEILDFAAAKNIPVGFNIESISNKKDEIDAAVEILSTVKKELWPSNKESKNCIADKASL